MGMGRTDRNFTLSGWGSGLPSGPLFERRLRIKNDKTLMMMR